MESRIKVKKSLIDGRGVFAAQDLERGQYILAIKGKLKHWMVKDKKSSLVGPNWVGYSKNLWINVVPPITYLNHSCDPNVGIRGRVRVYALKDIKEGEELTLDYSITEADPLWEMRCHCGSKLCRHTIRSIQSLPKTTFRKYLPYVPTYFKKIYLHTQT